eukprot:TRINITY_DN2019_c1_g2_i2.p1 TRINITY_DN2019_c1_g2~~TRINITY_DN2019_c1_g2_i2.p1  ORF type:complete len:281 (-),score=33.01 TRINITY_DN2019_c1_g2_i2:175-1017(-)
MHVRAHHVDFEDEVYERYPLGKLLGEGAFSEVYSAVDLDNNNEKVAIKIIRKLSKEDLWTSRKGAQKDEIKVLMLLNHPNIIKFKEFYQTRDKIFLLEEYCDGGNLQEVIRKEKGLCETRAKQVFKQCLTAVQYLHEIDIIHRDIKSENILFKEKGVDDIRLLDFGLSRLMPRAELVTTSAVGTLDYKAPEICARKPYGNSCDIWSLGVVLYDMLTGSLPCLFSSEENVITFAQDGVRLAGPKWDEISAEAKDLVSNLLVFEPEKRLTCKTALEHEWFNT